MIDTNLEQARFNMVQQQIRTWEVLDSRVLEVLETIPRDAFVPDAYRSLAYADIEIPIGNDQNMMFPRVEARLMQSLDVHPDNRILEIGTGSGYLTACLASLGSSVKSLEIHSELAEQAGKNLESQKIDNVELHTMDALAENIEGAPFDVVAITGSLPELPDSLKKLLSLNGRLFVVTGAPPVMEASLVTRVGEDGWRIETLFETELIPLANAPRLQQFQF